MAVWKRLAVSMQASKSGRDNRRNFMVLRLTASVGDGGCGWRESDVSARAPRQLRCRARVAVSGVFSLLAEITAADDAGVFFNLAVICSG
ncbi:hypothetical protein HPP92_021080 [Vanilla planifolia]|uniref:Uncharacterized protein n=1 Tax=Vanilla planifolia TaxID=51239 RepID=A0A835PZ70_VANPL|nr:hypothetical protein HPP92_021080 [Vanilla planifolia]